MTETGVVTEVKKNYAVVSVDKKAECEGCGLCLFKDGTNKTEFYAKNDLNAKVGDKVLVERSENGRFYGALLAFFVPLMLIGLAVAINYLFIKNEIWILILSIAFVSAWFVALCLTDKKLKSVGAFKAEITAITSEDPTGETPDASIIKE